MAWKVLGENGERLDELVRPIKDGLGINHLGRTKSGIEEAANMQQWKEERELCQQWPHLQAYWLVHHLVCDNRVALGELCALPPSSYPAIPALRSMADDLLAGKTVRASLWNSEKIDALRQKAFSHGQEHLFEEAALHRMKKGATEESKLVRHSKFGRGTIVSESGHGESLKLEVEFEDGTRKVLLARFLERV